MYSGAGAHACVESRFDGCSNSGNWSVTFGGCSFYGNTNGSPLVRVGSCTTQPGNLYLESKGITALPADVFDGMEKMT